MRPVEEQMPLLMQGVDYGDEQIRQNMEAELRERLREDRPLRGFTSGSILPRRISIWVTPCPFVRLRQFQELGHDVTFLIGNFTGLIGDPSDKTRHVPCLRPNIDGQAKTYTDQAFKIPRPEKTRIRYNATWLSQLSFADVHPSSRLTSRLRNSWNETTSPSAITREIRSILHEFFYALMQGLRRGSQETDVQVGGPDQLSI